jgi:hypothetical protein
MRFQEVQGLQVDGAAGPITRAKIGRRMGP